MSDTTPTPTPDTPVKRYWVDPSSRLEPDGTKNDMVLASDYDRIEAAALSAVNRLHEAQVELLRLAALTPKIWTAETIKDAPEGQYVMMDNDWQRWGHWTTLTVDSARKGLNGVSGRYPCAYGPLPTPDSGNPHA